MEIKEAVTRLEATRKMNENYVSNKLHHFYELAKEETEALEIALRALREEEQREEGCDYCHNENGFTHINDTCEYSNVNISISERIGLRVRLHDGDGTLMDVVKINFCPMCGRKLKR